MVASDEVCCHHDTHWLNNTVTNRPVGWTINHLWVSVSVTGSFNCLNCSDSKHLQAITLHSYIQYAGGIALSTVCLVLLLLVLKALTSVSNMVPHRYTNPLAPHYAVPQLQSPFTLTTTLLHPGTTVSLSCCPLALYAAYSMSRTFFAVPVSPWHTLLEFSVSCAGRVYHTGSLDSEASQGCHTTRRCWPLLQYIYIFWFINSWIHEDSQFSPQVALLVLRI
jgi:hypothetical protein